MQFLTRVSRFSGINCCFWGSREDNYGKKAYRSEFTYVSTHYSRVPITTVNFYKILFENYRFKTHPQVNKSFTVQYIQKFLKISFFPSVCSLPLETDIVPLCMLRQKILAKENILMQSIPSSLILVVSKNYGMQFTHKGQSSPSTHGSPLEDKKIKQIQKEKSWKRA